MLPEQHEALLRHTLLAAAAGLQEAQQASDRHDIEAARAATLKKLGQVRAQRFAGKVPILLADSALNGGHVGAREANANTAGLETRIPHA